MTEKLADSWKIKINHRGRGTIERNCERVKNVRAISVRAQVHELPQVDVTFNASDVTIEVDGEGHELALCPTVAELSGPDGTIATLRAALVKAHEHAGCGDPPGTSPDVCSICRALKDTEASS